MFFRSGAPVVPADPLHHDEVRLFREDCGGALQVRGAQAARRVHQGRTAHGHLRRRVHRRRVLRHRVPPRRHHRLQTQPGQWVHRGGNRQETRIQG